MNIETRWKMVFLAASFNVLFEYSLRGYAVFFEHPFLPIFLFTQYFVIYTMLEDLIVRFKLSNSELLVVMWPLGLVPMALGTGIIFYRSYFLGINWITLFFVELCWWWALKGIITFYFANRIINRNWSHATMGWSGWLITAGYFSISFLFIRIFLRLYQAVQ